MHPLVYSLDQLDQLPRRGARYGVIGDPVAHSLSPFIHNPGFQDLEIDAEYFRIHLRPEDLHDGVEKLIQHGFCGWNCTVPHKVHIVPLCDRLDESARRFQAVNTIRLEEGRRIGFNTDGLGWVRAIREEFRIDVSELRIMILGIGGAGRALAIQAAFENCERLVLVNRTVEKARALQKEIDQLLRQGHAWKESVPMISIPLDPALIQKELQNIDLVVNCTSAGLQADASSLIPVDAFHSQLLVYDTIYKPAETQLLLAAKKAGAQTANGLSMLLHQGALAFEIWTGRTAPIDLMRESLYSEARKSV
jgi:shikimate dehydrogenase